MVGERERQRWKIELIASENYAFARGARGAGLVAHQQVRRGPARQALLRRLRVRRRWSSASPRSARWPSSRAPSTSTSSPTRARRRTWPPTSRVLKHRRPHPGHEPRPRRPPDPRLAGQLQRASGSRSTPTACARTTQRIDYDALERQAREVRPKMIVAGASAYPRIIDFERMARHRPRRGRAAVRGHGPHRRAGRGGPASQPVPARGPRHDDHPQDAARPARRPHLRARGRWASRSTRPSSRASRAGR